MKSFISELEGILRDNLEPCPASRQRHYPHFQMRQEDPGRLCNLPEANSWQVGKKVPQRRLCSFSSISPFLLSAGSIQHRNELKYTLQVTNAPKEPDTAFSPGGSFQKDFYPQMSRILWALLLFVFNQCSTLFLLEWRNSVERHKIPVGLARKFSNCNGYICAYLRPWKMGY